MKIKFTFNDEGESLRTAVDKHISDFFNSDFNLTKNTEVAMKLFDKISDPSVSDSDLRNYLLMGEFSDYVSEVMQEVSISKYIVFQDYIHSLKEVIEKIIKKNSKLADESKFIQSKLGAIDDNIILTFENPGQAEAMTFKTNLRFILKNLKKIDSLKGKLSRLRKYYFDVYKENVLDDKELVSELNKTLANEFKVFKDNAKVASVVNPNINEDKVYNETVRLYSDLIKHFSSKNFIKTTDKKSLLKEFEDKYTAVTKSLADVDNVATIMNDIKISIPISIDPKIWLKKFISDLHGDINEALKVRGDLNKDRTLLQEMKKDLAVKHQTYENSLREGKSKANYNKFISELPAKISAFESGLKDPEGIEGYLKSAGMVKSLDMTDIQFLNQSIKSAYDDVIKYLKDDKYASDKDALEKYRLDLQTLYAESSSVVKEINSKESLKKGPYAVIDKAHDLSITVDAVLDQLKPGKRLQDILKDNGYAIKIKDIDKLVNNIKSAIRDLGNIKTSEKENVTNDEINVSILNVLKEHDVVITEPSDVKTPKEFLTEKEAIEALNFIANKVTIYNSDIQDILKSKGIAVPKGTSYISHMKSLIDSSYSELLKLQQSEEFANLDEDYKKRLKVVMEYFEETSKYLSKYIEDMDKYDKALSEAVAVATKMISDFSKSVSNAMKTGYDATKKLMNKKIGIDK